MTRIIYTVELKDVEFELYSSRAKAEAALTKFCISKGLKLRMMDRFEFRVGDFIFQYGKIVTLAVH